jgi:hypothetical protein
LETDLLKTCFQPFTRDFPRADIYEMLSSDLLHQVIKGTFKDHLVTWVEEYLKITYDKAEAGVIMDEIDRRCDIILCYSVQTQADNILGLQRFRLSQGCEDSSKAGVSSSGPAMILRRS